MGDGDVTTKYFTFTAVVYYGAAVTRERDYPVQYHLIPSFGMLGIPRSESRWPEEVYLS